MKVALIVGIVTLLLISANVGVATIQRVGGPSTSSPQGVVSDLAAVLGVGAAARHTISTNGVGSVTLTPNEVQITIGAVTQGSTAQSASDANSKVINAILAQLSPLGIANLCCRNRGR